MIICVGLHAQQYETERYSFSQIKNYHTSSAWSLVIEKSNNFLISYPFSQFKEDVNYYTAESYYQLDAMQQAKLLFEQVLQESSMGFPFEKNTRYWLGLIYSKQGYHEEALKYLYDLVREPFGDDKDKEVLLHSAQSLSVLQRYDELTIVIEYYIKKYGSNVIPKEVEGLLGGLWLGMGIEAFESSRFSEALEYFKRADLQKVDGEKSPIHFEKSGLYQAAIYYIQEDFLAAIDILKTRLEDNSATLFEYSALLAIINGEQENIAESEMYAKDALAYFQATPTEHKSFELLQKSVYWYAYSLYEKKLYKESVSILDTLVSLSNEYFVKQSLQTETVLLQAQSLFKAGETQKALSLFGQYFPTSDERIKALFLSGQWQAGVRSIQDDSNIYLQGLAYYSVRDWELANDAFLKAFESTDIQKNDWLQYYSALSFYYSGSYKESLNAIAQFLEDNPYHTKIWDAYLVGSICALELGNNKRAIDYSLLAVRSAKSNEQRQIASVFSAELYMEEKKYEDAISLLSVFSQSNDSTSIAPRMLLSNAYANTGNIQKADNELKRIIAQFPNESLAREAAYKRGELYFTAGDYSEAEKLFKDFRFTYTNGIYTDFALYFEAESRMMQNDSNGAILLFTDLVNRYIESSYRFTSISKLVLLHRNLEEYGIALSFALLAQEEYPRDFVASTLGSQIYELTVLSSGTDDSIAKVQFEWEKAGKNDTKEGRSLAYELAALYMQNSNERATAVEILQELHAELKLRNGEYDVLANVLNSLGKIEREQGNCTASARYYLQEAEALASLPNVDNQSARALYGAVEAFECAGMIADATAVFIEMEKNYKETIWYDRAKTLLPEEN